MPSCPIPHDTWHDAHDTLLGRLVRTVPALWHVIPLRWQERRCPVSGAYADGWREGLAFAKRHGHHAGGVTP